MAKIPDKFTDISFIELSESLYILQNPYSPEAIAACNEAKEYVARCSELIRDLSEKDYLSPLVEKFKDIFGDPKNINEKLLEWLTISPFIRSLLSLKQFRLFRKRFIKSLRGNFPKFVKIDLQQLSTSH